MSKEVTRRGFLGAMMAGVGALVVGAAAVEEFEQIKRRDHVRKKTYSFPHPEKDEALDHWMLARRGAGKWVAAPYGSTVGGLLVGAIAMAYAKQVGVAVPG